MGNYNDDDDGDDINSLQNFGEWCSLVQKNEHKYNGRAKMEKEINDRRESTNIY